MIESMITDITSQIADWHALVLLGVITLIGFGRLVQTSSRMENAVSLGMESRQKFQIFCRNASVESRYESMNWLTANSHRIKMQMGSGYYGSYKPLNDVHIILEGLQELQRYDMLHRNDSLGLYLQDINILVDKIDKTFTRYFGALREEGSLHVKKIKNPFLWLREGVAWILSLLLLLLPLFGSRGAAKREKIMTGSRFQLAASLIGLVGSLITIISFVAL